MYYTNEEIQNAAKSLNAEIYKGIISKIEFFETDTDDIKEAAHNYLLLTDGELFDDELKVFYSRYYWFLIYSKHYQKLKGVDEGLQQQLFQIIESSESISDSVDWSVVEKMENTIKNQP